MKKILKTALTAVIACVSAVVMSVCVSAETEDLDMPLTRAKTTNGAWEQAITYDRNAFDCGRFTPDTTVTIEFELDSEWTKSSAPVELILFNYTTADPQIWAKIEPYEWDETTASFSYDDMVIGYGSDDFTTVDNLCIGDCGVVMTLNSMTITNCTVVEVTTTTLATTTESVIEITDPPATEATTAATTAAPESKDSSFSIMDILPFVVGGAILLAVIVTVIIIVKKNRGGGFY